MRVISGSARRRGLKSVPPSQGVRPILARIKKSLFDIIRPRLAGAAFLDLYAGTGAVGIEALSEGVSWVTFVDRNPLCLHVISQNVARLGFQDRARMVRADATRSLAHLGRTFDVIFMGPPYHDENWRPFTLTQPTLANIKASHLLTPDTWVIGQHHAKEPPVNLPDWTLFRQERYGDTRLSFFKHG